MPWTPPSPQPPGARALLNVRASGVNGARPPADCQLNHCIQYFQMLPKTLRIPGAMISKVGYCAAFCEDGSELVSQVLPQNRCFDVFPRRGAESSFEYP